MPNSRNSTAIGSTERTCKPVSTHSLARSRPTAAFADWAGQESSEAATGVHILIGDRERVPVGLGHPEQAARSKYPANLPDRRGRIAYMLQQPVGSSPIDAAVGQRQLVDIDDAAPDVGLCGRPATGFADHRWLPIHTDHQTVPAYPGGQRVQVSAGAAADVNRDLASAQLQSSEQPLLVLDTGRCCRGGVHVGDRIRHHR